MFCAGEYVARCTQVFTLKAADASPGECCTQIRIFTRAFSDSSPTRIARYIHHWSKRPSQSSCVRLSCCNTTRPLCQRWIPARCFAERNGKDSAVAMNGVEPKQQRNLQSRLFHGNALKFICAFCTAHIER